MDTRHTISHATTLISNSTSPNSKAGKALRPYVFIIDRLKPYGAERVCITLLEEFAKLGHRVILVTYGADHLDAPELNASIERIRLKRSSRKWRALGEIISSLRRTLISLNPKGVVAFMPLANVLTLVATRGTGLKVLVTEHNIPSMIIRRNSLSGFCLWICMWCLYPHASGIVAVSQDVKNSLIAYLPRTVLDVDVIYNPINYARLSTQTLGYQQAAERIATWHQALGAPDCLLIVGALKEAKGHSLAIDALGLLPDRFVLVFVGDGPLRQGLIAKVKRDGLEDRVHFVGEFRDVTAWMTMSHTVLVPSRWEGFGLVVAEAAYVKARVITSDALGVREIALKVGAIICSPDSRSLADAISGTEVSSASIESWKDEFDPACVALQYLRELDSK